MNVLIIGSAGGIGTQLVQDLQNLGYNLFLGYHKRKPIEGSTMMEVDARSFSSIDRFIKTGREKLGSIDSIVNLAGNLILKPAHLSTEQEFEETININLKSSFGIIRSAGSTLNDCSIVLTSTAAASIGLANHELIVSAKAGIEGLARSAAKTYAKKNIRINTVSPGLVDTPLASKITENAIALKASQKMHALGRIGVASDVSRMIRFLIDKENNWITGHNFIIDGGLSNTK
tara:strand:+ start:163 stop:858 length:696 start_codon:yes stop_codon:yes gene_type:complete